MKCLTNYLIECIDIQYRHEFSNLLAFHLAPLSGQHSNLIWFNTWKSHNTPMSMHCECVQCLLAWKLWHNQSKNRLYLTLVWLETEWFIVEYTNPGAQDCAWSHRFVLKNQSFDITKSHWGVNADYLPSEVLWGHRSSPCIVSSPSLM